MRLLNAIAAFFIELFPPDYYCNRNYYYCILKLYIYPETYVEALINTISSPITQIISLFSILFLILSIIRMIRIVVGIISEYLTLLSDFSKMYRKLTSEEIKEITREDERIEKDK